MAQIIKDFHFYSPSGRVWHLSAVATTHRPEPDVGYMESWLTIDSVYWTKTGYALSGAALDRLPQNLMDQIVDELHEYAFNN